MTACKPAPFPPRGWVERDCTYVDGVDVQYEHEIAVDATGHSAHVTRFEDATDWYASGPGGRGTEATAIEAMELAVPGSTQ